MNTKLLKWLLCLATVFIICLSLTIAVSAFDEAQDTNATNTSEAEQPRYGYTLLTDNEKYIYDRLLEGVNADQPLKSIELEYARALTEAELSKAFALFLGDHPECFWIDNSYSFSTSGTSLVSVSPVYNFEGEALTEAKIAFATATASILADLPQGNNYIKALYLHDALANKVTYLQVGLHQTAYGALVDGQAVCAGYAAAYQYLLRCAGIEAATVTGSSVDPVSNEVIPHAWNIVWISPDTCVYTDVTWDDQGETIYHYYFNISKEEIEADHTTNYELYTLPECEHVNDSYFDMNDCEVSSKTTPEEMALHFGSVSSDGIRSATVYYNDKSESFDSWIEKNIADLYNALNGSAGSYSYGYSTFGNEVHINIQGDFTTEYYDISIVIDDRFIAMGATEQRIAEGDSVYLVIVASPNYYFPTDYACNTSDGITVTRDSFSQITVMGRPRADATVTLFPPAEKTEEAKPDVTFTATGYDCGILSGLSENTIFSSDGINWYRSSGSEAELVNLEPGELQIINEGRDTTSDSVAQIIVLTRKELAELNVLQPSTMNRTGTVSAEIDLEYSTDFENWTYGGKSITGLLPEIYYIRATASGHALASEEITVEISCNHAMPDEWETNNSAHSRSCFCGEKAQSEKHEFGEWKKSSSGEHVRACEICGFEEKKSDAPSSPSDDKDNSSNKPGTVINSGTHTGTLNSGCSITLSSSAVILILSLSAAAFASKKRK